MTTVREATWDLLRSLGMTTIFGNPGSTEEPFLQDFPDDFRYILGLQEAAVIGMADGFAQASDNAAFVNLLTAPGVGHAMGNLVTAWHNQAPLVVTAGQQTRAMLAMEPWLVNREAVELPKPYVKWSNERPRPDDVPAAIQHADHIAMQPPRGPVFVSIPGDDGDAPAPPRPCRAVSCRAAPDPAALDRIANLLQTSRAPVIVAGPGIDRGGGWDAAIALAERLETPVWSAPAPERAGFPQPHRLFQGFLPLAIGPIADALAPYDLALVFGAPIFRYHPYIPGPYLAESTRLVLITDNPDEAARAPVGDAVIGDVALAIDGLLARMERAPTHGRVVPMRSAPGRRAADRADVAGVRLANAGGGDAGRRDRGRRIGVDPWPVLRPDPDRPAGRLFRGRQRRPRRRCTGRRRPIGAAGAAGRLHRRRRRRHVCHPGALAAAHERAPGVFVVLNNGHYAILKGFAAFGQHGDRIPDLDLPHLDIAAIARGFGCDGRRVERAAELPEAPRRAFAAHGDGVGTLLNVAIDPTVPDMFPRRA